LLPRVFPTWGFFLAGIENIFLYLKKIFKK
jgi:hypothetical protein